MRDNLKSHDDLTLTKWSYVLIQYWDTLPPLSLKK